MGDTTTWLADRMASLIPNMLPVAMASASSSSFSSPAPCSVAVVEQPPYCYEACTQGDPNAPQKWKISDTGTACVPVRIGCCTSA
jgi:hypothetical protein